MTNIIKPAKLLMLEDDYIGLLNKNMEGRSKGYEAFVKMRTNLLKEVLVDVAIRSKYIQVAGTKGYLSSLKQQALLTF